MDIRAKRQLAVGGRYPYPLVFCSKSAETFENMRDGDLQGAKNCKRVQKNVKRKEIEVMARASGRGDDGAAGAESGLVRANHDEC
jgi:hypothetical protein